MGARAWGWISIALALFVIGFWVGLWVESRG